jgi:thiol-disulfide isomerase/thioredoxin
MRPVLLFACFCLSVISLCAQKTPASKTPGKAAEGYSIKLKITPLKNSRVYLYNYYGKEDRFQLTDSVMLNDKSEGIFKGDKKLFGGIYILVSDRRVRLMDFLMEDDQDFTIAIDTAHAEKGVITGSKENTLYQEYARFLETVGPKQFALEQELKIAKTKEDSAELRKKIAAVSKEMQQYRDGIIKKYPGSMLASFFNTMKTPEAPTELPVKADGTKDSAYPYRFVQAHYWDDVNLADERLVRTPFFERKLDEYLKYYVAPQPDSVIREVKYMLLYARESKEMYRYLLAKFTNKYILPEIMGQDKVFLYLFKEHYLKGDTVLLTEKDRKTVMDRGWNLWFTMIDSPAVPLDLVSRDGRPTPLYDLKATYTLVVFWDPDCGHCKETVPRIDSIYRAKWKALGMKIYAVNIDEATMKAWDEFITKHSLQEWTHVYEPKAQREKENAEGKMNFRQAYDVYKTPTIYLLDEQKRIIAKQLDIEGFDEVLYQKMKAKK